MMRRLPAFCCLRLWLILFPLIHAVTNLLHAEQFGIYTYTVTPQNTIAISRVAMDASGSITIPSTINGQTVTAIWSYAFLFCTGITSVALPPSVTTIGDRAFLNCSGLTNITFSASLLSIGNWAFHGCTKLNNIDLPPLLASIGKGAFLGCVSLTDFTFPSALSSIGDGAFDRCTRLSSITIPPSITSIGRGVFSSCSSLFSVHVHPDSQTYSSLNGVLFDKSQATLITFPAGIGGFYTIPSQVTSIWTSAFDGCRRLSRISFPSSLTSIPTDTFSSCAELASFLVHSQNQNYSTINGVLFNKNRTTLIAFPVGNGGAYTIPQGVTAIGDSAFNLAFNLTSVTCPASLASIGNTAFYACTDLTSITLPDTITSIGNLAFSFCYSLTRIALPASITSVGDDAFSSCLNLSSIAFLGDAPTGLILTEIANSLPPGYATCWLSSKTGFTAPIWQGYPAVRIDETAYPAASWLLQNDQPYDSDLQQDPNGDGVSLLMAYALNLDPRINLSASLPAPVLHPDRLSLTFHAASAGITYEVETSTGLDQWTTDGVTVSAIGADQHRTASVPRSGPGRFLRLKVAD